MGTVINPPPIPNRPAANPAGIAVIIIIIIKYIVSGWKRISKFIFPKIQDLFFLPGPLCDLLFEDPRL